MKRFLTRQIYRKFLYICNIYLFTHKHIGGPLYDNEVGWLLIAVGISYRIRGGVSLGGCFTVWGPYGRSGQLFE